MEVAVPEGCVRRVAQDQAIDFGMISSCLGLVVKCQNGPIVAAHCVLVPDLEKQKTFDEIIEEVRQLSSEKPIESVELVGALDYWNLEDLDKIKQLFGKVTQFNTSDDEAVDVSYSPDKGVCMKSKRYTLD